MNDLLTKTGDAIETVIAMIDAMDAHPGVDRRALAVARTNFETAFLWAASAVQGPSIFQKDQ